MCNLLHFQVGLIEDHVHQNCGAVGNRGIEASVQLLIGATKN